MHSFGSATSFYIDADPSKLFLENIYVIKNEMVHSKA